MNRSTQYARVVVACAGFLVIAGCQTNYQYVRIGAGPELAYAQAQCEIMSGSVEQGVVAWGTPSYVASAQIGNALGNAIRVDQFMKNCMILQGWQRVPVATSTAAATRKPAYVPPKPAVKGKFPPAPRPFKG